MPFGEKKVGGLIKNQRVSLLTNSINSLPVQTVAIVHAEAFQCYCQHEAPQPVTKPEDSKCNSYRTTSTKQVSPSL